MSEFRVGDRVRRKTSASGVWKQACIAAGVPNDSVLTVAEVASDTLGFLEVPALNHQHSITPWLQQNYERVDAGVGPFITPPKGAHDFCTAAMAHMDDRAVTYDAPHGERSMAKTVAAFNAITEHTLTEEQGWLFMEVLKMARSQQGEFKADNYEDAVAYAALRGEAAIAARGAV